jgi:phage tail tube protein FII
MEVMKCWLPSLLLILFVSRIAAAVVTITTASVPNGTVKTAYSAVIKADSGCTPYKWTVVSGTLPAGVSAKASSTTTSLNLAGTPTTAATYNFAVKVTACGGGVSQKTYKVVIQDATSGVAITTTSVPNGTVKTAYSAVIKADSGCTPYKWTVVSGTLPAGVSAKASSTTTSLNLAGTPTTAATYNFAVKVTACDGGASQKTYKVVVQAAANHVVELSWNASTSSDVIGYNVYRSLDGATWKRINPSLAASTLYSDSTVANSTTYYYAATAVDSSGHESTKTARVKAVVP